ncbi:MAG: hypothetical protein ACJAQ2_001135, partial [Vicingaceae bacterium]
LLPELLVNHFEITAFKTENKDIHISFIENKTTPKEETNPRCRTIVSCV